MAGVILFNLFGYYFLFRTEQFWVREAMHGMIRNHLFTDKECEKITIEKGDPSVKWLDEDEFCRNGMYYDVISVEHRDNQLVITCINDRQEANIITTCNKTSQIAGSVNSTQKSRTRTALLHHLIKQALPDNQVPLFSPENKKNVAFPEINKHSETFLSITGPPPEIS